MKKFFIGGILLATLFIISGCSADLNMSGTVTPEDNQEQAENKTEIIRKLFAEKYGKKVEEITVTISEEDATHARGGVKMGDPAGPGGLFLVAQKDGAWQLVFDGNGNYFCEDVAPYDFPANMIRDCASKAEMEAAANVSLLKNAFAAKFNRNANEIEVTIGKSAENKFFRGNVRSGSGIGSAGMFIAVKDSAKNAMNIVVSGSGTYTCAEVIAYDFPVEFISDCSR
jgi:hypothetical protein